MIKHNALFNTPYPTTDSSYLKFMPNIQWITSLSKLSIRSRSLRDPQHYSHYYSHGMCCPGEATWRIRFLIHTYTDKLPHVHQLQHMYYARTQQPTGLKYNHLKTWRGSVCKCASRKKKGQHLVGLLICASHLSHSTWTRHSQRNTHFPLRLWVAQWGSQISTTS